jgi:hypothetical protein
VTLLELPRRGSAPRVFVELPAGLDRRVKRALSALGDLPEELRLPGLPDLADALIAIADELDGDADLEPEEDEDQDEMLPLFAFAGLMRPP